MYVYYRELGGSCKLILDVIKCEPPVVKVINYDISSNYIICIEIHRIAGFYCESFNFTNFANSEVLAKI